MKNEPLLRAAALKFVDNPMTGVESHNVQLLKSGLFHHPQYGDIEINTAYLESMVKNFQDNVRGIDLAIDYSHNSDQEAAGWIESVYLSDDKNELWAKVRWTKKGCQIVIDKEFRYLSAEFHKNYVNNETNIAYGPTLLGAGLTNRPFLKGMTPVLELSEKPKEGNKKMDEKDKQISDLMAQIETLKKQLGDKVASGDQDGGDDGDKNMADMKSKNDALNAQCADLQKKVQAYADAEAANAKSKALSEKKEAFDKLMLAGKAVEAQREPFMTGDAVKFAESFTPPNMKATGSGADALPPAKDSADAQDQISKLAEKLLSEKKVSTIGEGIRMVLNENPELKAKYQS